MNEALNQEEELEFKDTKYPHLKLAIGGKGPVDPDDTVWLKRYDVGSVFRIKRKGDYIVPLVVVEDRSDKTYTLTLQGVGTIPVDPFAFCQIYQFYELVRTSEETMAIVAQKEQKETSNGTSDGAVRHGDVVDVRNDLP
jgi:hypothetical protein